MTAEKDLGATRPHVFIAGQFPPPVTGFAFITAGIARFIADRYETTIIDLSPHRKRGGVSYHLLRLTLALGGVLLLLRRSTSNSSKIFYIACDGGAGLIYTIILCIAARLLRHRIYVHHHSFSYITAFSRLMSCILSITGEDATHIFLCETMANLFVRRYKKALRFRILSNSAFVDATPGLPQPKTPRQNGALVIGLLSNLNNAKGLGIFLDLLRRTACLSMNIRGVLAGPPDTDAERDMIKTACRELGDKLEYRGQVYGEAKDDFFRSTDVFVFPTRYANEAQPTVVFEALAHGIPVLSFDRGCIRGQVGACGAVQERDADFLPFALEWLNTQLASPADFAQVRIDARAAFMADQKLAKANAATLFDNLGETFHPC
jgi:glycosyltransferase involved in cell wall biosynthesis